MMMMMSHKDELSKLQESTAATQATARDGVGPVKSWASLVALEDLQGPMRLSIQSADSQEALKAAKSQTNNAIKNMRLVIVEATSALDRWKKAAQPKAKPKGKPKAKATPADVASESKAEFKATEVPPILLAKYPNQVDFVRVDEATSLTLLQPAVVSLKQSMPELEKDPTYVGPMTTFRSRLLDGLDDDDDADDSDADDDDDDDDDDYEDYNDDGDDDDDDDGDDGDDDGDGDDDEDDDDDDDCDGDGSDDDDDDGDEGDGDADDDGDGDDDNDDDVGDGLDEADEGDDNADDDDVFEVRGVCEEVLEWQIVSGH